MKIVATIKDRLAKRGRKKYIVLHRAKFVYFSIRADFAEERKQLLEVIGPELQSIYDDMGIEVSK